MRYLVVLCTLFGLVIADASFNSEVDGWLKDWYSSKLLVKRGLEGLMYSWTEGHLWWTKSKTVRCYGGLVDLTDGVRLARVDDAVSNLLKNSSRPWVTVTLSLEPSARFAFYGCGLDNSTDGLITGKLLTTNGLDLVFTYKKWELVFCSLETISLKFSPEIRIDDFQLDGLSAPVPTEVQDRLQQEIIDQVLEVTAKSWTEVMGDGPKCPNKYC